MTREIAIVGAAVRLPGASTPDELFERLLAGTIAARPLPEERAAMLAAAGLDPPSRARMGGFLDDVRAFDPDLFGMTEAEVQHLDPQQRLFLDACWEALERAGLRPDRLPHRRAGVFVGIASNDYTQWTSQAGSAIDPARISGSLGSFAASRVAYALDLHGPATAIDAACASSLLAVHLAVQSLRAGETKLCIAGGANLLLLAETTELFDSAGLLSSDGRCRAFDDEASGYFRSEGAVALVLERLSDAIAAGRDILAVIKGSAVAQEGKRRAGLVAPGVNGQREAVLAAIEDAAIDPSSVGLIEAQGTATLMGDALEVRALGEAYGSKAARCALGSVKTRFGHLEAAAGATALLTAALSLEKGIIPPNGAVRAPSRMIELEETPFFLADRARSFARGSNPRRAAVHCYGMGGTNVHVILEEPPAAPAIEPVHEEQPELFLLSARTRALLDAEVDSILRAIATDRSGSLAEWCRAVNARRKPRAVRLAIVARTLDQLADRLHIFRLAGERDSLAASWIFGPKSGEGVLDEIRSLSREAKETIRRATSGRWAEKHLHPLLATEGDASQLARAELMKILGRVFVAGGEVDLTELCPGKGRVPLPPEVRAPRTLWAPIRGARIDRREARQQVVEEVRVPEIAAQEAEVPEPDARAPSEGAMEDRTETILWRCLERASMQPIAKRDPEVSFLDLGIDSVGLARFATILEQVLGRPLPAGAAFEHPTIAALAAKIGDQITQEAEGRIAELERAEEAPGAPTREPFALTPLQQAYLAAAEMQGTLGGRSCQVFVELEIEGEADHARLERSLSELIERHPMLGAVFTKDGTQRYAVQEVEIPRVRIDDESAIAPLRAELLSTGAPLDRGPMIRARLAELPGRFRILLTVDLIAADLESIRIVIEEWRERYLHPERALPPLSLTFDRYLALLEARTSRERRELDRAYWTERIDRIPEPPALPLARDPSRLQKATFRSLRRVLPPEVWARFRDRAKSEGVTPSALLGAAFGEMLARFGNGRDFCLNLPVFDRRPIHADVERIVGPFSTNLLVALSGAEGDVVERARRFEAEVREGLEHRTFSGVELARAIAQRRRSLAPIAPVVFTAPLYGRSFDPWGRAVEVASQTPHVWLDCQAVESEGGLVLRWDYVEELFHPETIATMFRDFAGTVQTLAEAMNPASDGTEAKLFSEASIAQAARAPTLDGFVAEQAKRSPHQRAVIAGGRSITYAELDRLANRTANSLRRSGIRAGDRVVIACERGIDQIAMVVGVLRASAAYVPLDPSQPDARASQIVEDARAQAILVDEKNRDRSFVRGRAILTTDALACSDETPPPSERAPEDLAYVIFTSGSTGRPKGVMISHAAAINTIEDINRRFHLGPFDRVLAFSSLGFDLSVWDLFGSFAAGATVVVLPDEHLKSPSRWMQLIEEEGVTVWSSVPTGMSMLVDFFEGRKEQRARTLRLVMLSGDWIPVSLPDRIRALFAGASVISLGGATEGSIWSCIRPIGAVDPSWTSIPYGRAMTRQSFHILDERMNPVAPGEVGELYIGGAGVALGYFGDEARTRERFVEGPPGVGRLYRTGDLGRWRPDGEMEFLGRQDMQVKIRGFRVELAEIEAALRSHPGIADCVVSARGERNDKELIAHYVARSAVDSRDLLEHLRERLPEYMVPQRLVRLEALPLSANGKIDRAALS